jgi:membrane protein
MTLKDHGRAVWDFIRKLFREFSKDYGAMVSAAMSFYALLSLSPLLILAVAVLAYVLHSPEKASAGILDYFNQFSPSLAIFAQALLRSIIKGRVAAGGFALVALLWAGSQFFVSLEMAVNIAWDVKHRRGFVRQRVVALIMVLAAGMLLLLNLGVTTLVAVVRNLHVWPALDNLLQSRWLWTIGSWLFTFVLTTAMYIIVYKFLPNRKVKWRDALWGAAVAGVLWEIAKYAFSWYVPHLVARYNAIYGSLAGLVILMIWIYYSSIVTVIGAEVAALHAHVREQG